MNLDKTPKEPKKDLDCAYILSNRSYQIDEYLSFLAACIEQSEETIIHTEGSGKFRDLLRAGLKGLQHTIKDRKAASFGKGLDHINVEYEDFSKKIIEEFGELASKAEEYEGRHVFYFEQNELSLLAQLIREIDDLEKDTMAHIETLNTGFYTASRPRSYMADQKLYVNEEKTAIVEEVNELVYGEAKCVLDS